MPKCFKCERDLEFEFGRDDEANSSPIGGGGFLEASFHWGSRHDQGGENWRNPRRHKDPSRLGRMLQCDKIQGYICDDCFERHLDLFDGYHDLTVPAEKKYV
jgi:hypothetical protein